MSRLLIVTSGLAILGILAALVWPAMGGLTLLLFVLSLLVTLAIFLFLFLLWTLRRFGWIRLAPRFPRVVLAVLLVLVEVGGEGVDDRLNGHPVRRVVGIHRDRLGDAGDDVFVQRGGVLLGDALR